MIGGRRYFTGRLFAGRYWPKVGGSGSTPTVQWVVATLDRLAARLGSGDARRRLASGDAVRRLAE